MLLIASYPAFLFQDELPSHQVLKAAASRMRAGADYRIRFEPNYTDARRVTLANSTGAPILSFEVLGESRLSLAVRATLDGCEGRTFEDSRGFGRRYALLSAVFGGFPSSQFKKGTIRIEDNVTRPSVTIAGDKPDREFTIWLTPQLEVLAVESAAAP